MSDSAATAEPGTPPARQHASEVQNMSTRLPTPALTRSSRARSAAPSVAAKASLKKTQSVPNNGSREAAARPAKTAATAAMAAITASEATNPENTAPLSSAPVASLSARLLPAAEIARPAAPYPAPAAKKQRSPSKATVVIDKAEYDAYKKSYEEMKKAYEAAMVMMTETKDAFNKVVMDVQDLEGKTKQLELGQAQANSSYASVVKQSLDIQKIQEENARHKQDMQEVTAATRASTKAVLEGRQMLGSDTPELPQFEQASDCVGWLAQETRLATIRDTYCEKRITRKGKTQYIIHFNTVRDL